MKPWISRMITDARLNDPELFLYPCKSVLSAVGSIRSLGGTRKINSPHGLAPIGVFAALIFLFSLGCGVRALAEETLAGLRAEPAEIDFGRAAQHQVREAKVKLTNTGKDPLTFLPPRTDCGCTTASLSKVTLLPGETSLLTVKLETRAETGTVHRMVIVHASSGDLAVPVTIEIVPALTP